MAIARHFVEPIGRSVAIVVLVAVLAGIGRGGEQTSDKRSSAAKGSEKSAPAATKPSIVAWVDSSPIYYSDVQRAAAVAMKGKSVEPDKLPRVLAGVLQQLIDEKIVSDYLETSQIAASADEIEGGLAEFNAKLQQQKQTLSNYLADNKTSETALRKKLGREIALQKYVAKSVNDDALQQYFHDHRPQFDGTQRRVSHIVFRPLGVVDEASIRSLVSQAKQLRGRIVVGEISFESAATKYSDGPSRFNGGDLGFIPRQGVASQQFSEAAFALKANEISQPVLDPFGVHLIKSTDSKPGQKTWQDARDELKAAYTRVMFAKLIEEVRRKAKVEFIEDFPHFLPGTTELAPPPAVGASQ